MNLNDLFLRKDELPITHETLFEIPIHPKLLDPNIKIDNSIAQRIFPQVTKEWHYELSQYAKTEKDIEKRKWYKEVFLKKGFNIKKIANSQYIGTWEDHVLSMENGLIGDFMISRNGGGSLYFSKEDSNCESSGILNLRFKEDKKKEFMFEKNKFFVYASHNIDFFPGALFLRNWALMYMNEVFKEVF